MDDGDLYSLGIAKPLDEKIELALGNIRHYSRAAAIAAGAKEMSLREWIRGNMS